MGILLTASQVETIAWSIFQPLVSEGWQQESALWKILCLPATNSLAVQHYWNNVVVAISLASSEWEYGYGTFQADSDLHLVLWGSPEELPRPFLRGEQARYLLRSCSSSSHSAHFEFSKIGISAFGNCGFITLVLNDGLSDSLLPNQDAFKCLQISQWMNCVFDLGILSPYLSLICGCDGRNTRANLDEENPLLSPQSCRRVGLVVWRSGWQNHKRIIGFWGG